MCQILCLALDKKKKKKVDKTDTIPSSVKLGGNCNPEHGKDVSPRGGRSTEAFYGKGEPTEDQGKECSAH